MADFDTFRVIIYNILNDLDTRKSRGPNGYPTVFFQKTVKPMCTNMHKLVKNIKRLSKIILDCSKVSAVTLIYKKDDKRLVENYRPVSLLNIESKELEICIYKALYRYFEK